MLPRVPRTRLLARVTAAAAIQRKSLPLASLHSTCRTLQVTETGTSGLLRTKDTKPITKSPVHKLTPLTAEKHPEIKRLTKYKVVDQADLAFFRSVLGDHNVLYSENIPTTQDHALMPYNVDWLNLYRGTSQTVLFPRSTADVSQVLKYCNDKLLAVTPQGGNSGVSGGATPVFDEIIINMSKMNTIRKLDPISGAVVADAGVILEVLDNYLEKEGYMVPLDLGAKGSCQIGGNVSTNAGGLRLMRYGSLHGSVLGLEVVLPDGTILDNLTMLRKDNTGYDVKQLFIGAEGTLGMVTGVSILAPRRAKSQNLALFALHSYEDVQKAFMKSKSDLGEILSAFEFWDSECVDVVKTKMLAEHSFPIASEKPFAFYALLETQGSNQQHDEEKMTKYLEAIMDQGIAVDGVVAQDAKQMRSIWTWRELIPEALTKYGPALTYDLGLEVPLLYQLCEDAKKHFETQGLLSEHGEGIVKMLGFGHIGDGNLHLMAATKHNDHVLQHAIDDYVFQWTSKHRGSISAEHGIGIMKRAHLGLSKTQPVIDVMKGIKNLLDPNGIMNPYKVL